jgi:hypothetical protein
MTTEPSADKGGEPLGLAAERPVRPASEANGLVQRLRDYYTEDRDNFRIDHPICDEAANEIERLQEELAKFKEQAEERDKWKALRDRIRADIDRPEGRWGMHGRSAVDDDYFEALEWVLDRMDEALRPNV